MENDDLMKKILEKLDESTSDLKKELNSLASETRTGFVNINNHISSIDVTQARQQVILEEHIRRTEVNEETLALHREKHDEDVNKLSTKIEPIEKHINMWAGAGKVLAILGTLGAILGGIAKFIFH